MYAREVVTRRRSSQPPAASRRPSSGSRRSSAAGSFSWRTPAASSLASSVPASARGDLTAGVHVDVDKAAAETPSNPTLSISNIVQRALKVAEVEVKAQLEERIALELDSKRLTGELRASLSTCAKLTTELVEARDENAKLRRHMAALVERLNSVRSHNESLSRQSAREEQKSKQLQVENEELKKRLSSLQVDTMLREKLEAATHRLEEENTALKDKLASLTSTNADGDEGGSISQPAPLLPADGVNVTTDPTGSLSYTESALADSGVTETAFARTVKQQLGRRFSVDPEAGAGESQLPGEKDVAIHETSADIDVTVQCLTITEMERMSADDEALRLASPPSPVRQQRLSSSSSGVRRPWREPGPAPPLPSPGGGTGAGGKERNTGSPSRCAACSPTHSPPPKSRSPIGRQRASTTPESADKARIAELEAQLEAACKLAVLNATEAVKRENADKQEPRIDRWSGQEPPREAHGHFLQPGVQPPLSKQVPQIMLVALPATAPPPPPPRFHAPLQSSMQRGRQAGTEPGLHEDEASNVAARQRAEAALQVMEKAQKLRQALAAIRGQRSAVAVPALISQGQQLWAGTPTASEKTIPAAQSPVLPVSAPSATASISILQPALATTGGWRPKPLVSSTVLNS